MSEQDFFFDEEDSTTVATKSKATSPKPAQSTQKAASASFFEQDVSVAIAALLAVIALLIGMIVGVLIPTGGVATSTPNSPAAATGSDSAPQLTQDQIDSGALPSGHPDLSGGDSGAETETVMPMGN